MIGTNPEGPRLKDDSPTIRPSARVANNGPMVYDDYNGAFTDDVGSVREMFGREAAGNGVKIVLGHTRDHDQGKTSQYHLKDDLGALKASQHENQLDYVKFGRVRRLTPLECERLQGFPDGWTAGVSDTQRYKMLGNAVTVSVVEAIGRKMLQVEVLPSCC